jgi:hypothetical protein
LKAWTKTQGTNDDLKITDKDFVDCKVPADIEETGLIYILLSPATCTYGYKCFTDTLCSELEYHLL